MRFVDVRMESRKKVSILEHEDGQHSRIQTINIGEQLIFNPDNPVQSEYVNQQCVVKSFAKMEGEPLKAFVFFVDTKEFDYVNVVDLKVSAAASNA